MYRLYEAGQDRLVGSTVSMTGTVETTIRCGVVLRSPAA
jgi:hypothetical protein